MAHLEQRDGAQLKQKGRASNTLTGGRGDLGDAGVQNLERALHHWRHHRQASNAELGTAISVGRRLRGETVSNGSCKCAQPCTHVPRRRKAHQACRRDGWVRVVGARDQAIEQLEERLRLQLGKIAHEDLERDERRALVGGRL